MSPGQLWFAVLDGLARLRPDARWGGDAHLLKLILACIALCMLLPGMSLLRAARWRAGGTCGWHAFREWGVPVTLIVSALVLVCVNDGGRGDRFLARLHWRFLERLQLAPSPAGRGGDALQVPEVGREKRL